MPVMNKRIMSLAVLAMLLLSLCACNKAEKTEILETTAMPVETIAETIVEATETIPAIDSEDAYRETEPQSNKATVITENQGGTVIEVPENAAGAEVVIVAPETSEGDAAQDQVEATPVETEYEKFLKMSGEEQKEYMYSFATIDDFVNWLENAKLEYEAAHPSIEIGGDAVITDKIG